MIAAAVTTLTAFLFLVFGRVPVTEEALVKVFARARAVVAEVVQDEQRRKEIKTIWDDSAAVVRDIDEVLVERRLEFLQVDADYGATLADYERVIEWLDGAWADGFDKLVDLRGSIIGQMTAEEWQAAHERLLGSGAGKARRKQHAVPGNGAKDQTD